MNDLEWQEYQKISFDYFLRYVSEAFDLLVLPFEAIQKLNSPSLILLDHQIRLIEIRQAVKPYVEAWPKDFDSELIYYTTGYALENTEQIGKFFAHLSMAEQINLICLRETQKRVRMVLGQRIQGQGFDPKKILPGYFEQDSLNDKFLYATGVRILHLNAEEKLQGKLKKNPEAKKVLVPNSLIRALMGISMKYRTILGKAKEVVSIELRNDALTMLYKLINGLEGKVINDNLPEVFRKIFMNSISEKEWSCFSENRKRWNRESWTITGLNILQTRLELTPILEMKDEDGPKKVNEDFKRKDQETHQKQDKEVKLLGLGALTYKIEFQDYLRRGAIPQQEDDPVQRDKEHWLKNYTDARAIETAIRFVSRTPAEAAQLTEAVKLIGATEKGKSVNETKVARKIGMDRLKLTRLFKRLKVHLKTKFSHKIS